MLAEGVLALLGTVAVNAGHKECMRMCGSNSVQLLTSCDFRLCCRDLQYPSRGTRDTFLVLRTIIRMNWLGVLDVENVRIDMQNESHRAHDLQLSFVLTASIADRTGWVIW